MTPQQQQIVTTIQQRLNNKHIDHERTVNWGTDFFGNRVGTRFNVVGDTQASEVSFDGDATSGLVTITFQFDYTRKQFRGIQPPIQEQQRNQQGKMSFSFLLDAVDGLVLSEKSRETPFPRSHDATATACDGVIADVIKPAFRIR